MFSIYRFVILYTKKGCWGSTMSSSHIAEFPTTKKSVNKVVAKVYIYNFVD